MKIIGKAKCVISREEILIEPSFFWKVKLRGVTLYSHKECSNLCFPIGSLFQICQNIILLLSLWIPFRKNCYFCNKVARAFKVRHSMLYMTYLKSRIIEAVEKYFRCIKVNIPRVVRRCTIPHPDMGLNCATNDL